VRRTSRRRSGGPIRLLDVELTDPIAEQLPAGNHGRVRILVRLHGHPLGTVNLPAGGAGVGSLDPALVAAAVWDQMAERIVGHCEHDGLAAPETLTVDGFDHPAVTACSWRCSRPGAPFPFATVVITTCGGPGSRLATTVRDALAQSYPSFEVVVVDNRPSTSGVPALLDGAFPSEARLRYVAEPAPGLSHARNAGAAAATGELVAFTDDDVALDSDWLAYLVAGFDDPAVACVTGLILPLELETDAQRLLEEFGGYAKGFDRKRWDLDEHRPDNALYPYTVGAFGSGASAAFRGDALAAIGGFDNALGAGTAARGGEDIDIYVTCVQHGYQIVYEPAAIIRHAHNREMDQVHQKVRDYGVGLGAMLTKHLFRDWPTFVAMLTRLPLGARHLLGRDSTKNAGRTGSYPASLIAAELAGLVYGPFAYLRSRRSS
jgi:GT2 family glycosyltransferase